MDKQLIKEFYFRELESKSEHDARVAVLVGILSLVAGLLFFCWRNFGQQGPALQLAFTALFVLASIFYVLAVLQVLRANIGHTYERLPFPEELYAYRSHLEDYYREVGSSSGDATADFEDFLARHMISATSRNARTNLVRSARNYSATRFAAFAVVVGIVAAGVVLLSKPHDTAAVLHVDRAEVKEVLLPKPIGGSDGRTQEPVRKANAAATGPDLAPKTP